MLQSIGWTTFLDGSVIRSWWPLAVSVAIIIAVAGLTARLRHKYKGDEARWEILTPRYLAWAPLLLLSTGLWCFVAQNTGYPWSWMVWVEATLGILFLRAIAGRAKAGKSTVLHNLCYTLLLIASSALGGTVAATEFLRNSSLQDENNTIFLLVAGGATLLLAGLAYLVGLTSFNYIQKSSALLQQANDELETARLQERYSANLERAESQVIKHLQHSVGLREGQPELLKPVESAVHHGAKAVPLSLCDSETDAYIELSAQLGAAWSAARAARQLQDQADEAARQETLRQRVTLLHADHIMLRHQLHPNRRPDVLEKSYNLAPRIEREFLTNETTGLHRMAELWDELGLNPAWYMYDPDRVFQLTIRGQLLITPEERAERMEQIGRIAMSLLAHGCTIDNPHDATQAVFAEWIKRHGSKLELANLEA